MAVRRDRARQSKWPPQQMPTPDRVMRDLVVLRRAARILKEPLYVFCDDAADFFSQLALAPEDWHLMGVIFLKSADDVITQNGVPPGQEGEPEDLIFVSERRLGFGTHPASNIAQRFSESLLHLFRQDMDAAEDEAMANDPNPALRLWRAERAQVQSRAGGKQDRLYASAIYCDDPIHACVGVARCIRMLIQWRKLTADSKLIMAIPQKRMLGSWLRWLGILFFAGLGFVLIPKDKIMRAVSSIQRTLSGTEEFSSYRSMVGLLEHFRSIELWPRSRMYGLYAPHKSDPEPNALVELSFEGRAALIRWRDALRAHNGAPFTRALGWRHITRCLPVQTFHIFSDAASDGPGAGLGGFMYGHWWYLPLQRQHLRHLHITALELLALGVGVLTFECMVPDGARIKLLSDAAATVSIITRHSASSPLLQHIHQLLLASEAFCRITSTAECEHVSGLCNVAADLASRGRIPELHLLCAQSRMRPERLVVPAAAISLVDQSTAIAARLGIIAPAPPDFLAAREHRRDDSEDHQPPRDMTIAQSRGSSFRSNSDGDGPPSLQSLLSSPQRRPTSSGLPEPARGQHHRRTSPYPPTDAGRSTGATRATNSLHRVLLASPAESLPLHVAAGALAQPRASASQSAGLPTQRLAGQLVVQAPAGLHAPLLTEATAEASRRGADRWQSSPFGRHMDLELLGELLAASSGLALHGAAHNTLRKDELAWSKWVSFAKWLGFDPIVKAEDAASHPDHLGTLLAQFLLWVYPLLRGRRGGWARPRSAFAYVLAVIRILKRWRVPCPPASAVKAELHGLLRLFADTFGRLALAPRRKEPFKFSMILDLIQLALSGLTLPRGRQWNMRKFRTRQVTRIMLFLWRTGHRLGSVVAHSSGALMLVTRADASYVIGAQTLCDPSPEELRSMRPGDGIWISPPRSKTDQFGETWCGYGSFLPYSSEDSNAAKGIRDLELERPCRGALREKTPLFADE